jgi:aspartyl protease family protein
MFKLVAPVLIVCAAMVVLIPHDRETPAASPRSTAGERNERPIPPGGAGNGAAGITLSRAANGHFYADALVNGATIRFLVDSGASAVVLTRADAQAAGIAAGTGDFTATAHGAGGDVKLKPVTIDRLAIGPVAAERIEGAVAERGLPVSLLGQTFLSRVSRVEISGDAMTLR